MTEVSGAQWCARFPTSTSVDDLTDEFAPRVSDFIAALKDAGASVTISATHRPAERAYLMHWCLLVCGYTDKNGVFQQIAADQVPPMDGVDIDWTHGGDDGAARDAGRAMAEGYGIVYPASLTSRHIDRRAIDMTIHNAPDDVNGMGASFGVFKLVSDPPHWSDDGH